MQLLLLSFLVIIPALFVQGSPLGSSNFLTSRQQDLVQRTTAPYFPDEPKSCPICEKDYWSISSCAEAAPVLENFTMIIFNPGAFIDVIQCACTDTFKSVFPQCVDCFIQTGQSDVLDSQDLPAVVEGMRSVCAVASALLGNVSNTNGEGSTTASSDAASSTSDSSSDSSSPNSSFSHRPESATMYLGLALILLLVGVGDAFGPR